MREIFTYGSVGGALGNQCFYPEMRWRGDPMYYSGLDLEIDDL